MISFNFKGFPEPLPAELQSLKGWCIWSGGEGSGEAFQNLKKLS